MGHELVFFKDQRFSKSGENCTDLVFFKICYYHYLLLRAYSLYSFPLEGQGRDVIRGCVLSRCRRNFQVEFSILDSVPDECLD